MPDISAAIETLEFDVVIVGGGPAGLAAACRLATLQHEAGTALEICVLEKGSEIGAHIISGAIIDPRPLDELVPGWTAGEAPLTTRVTEDRLTWLTGGSGSVDLPAWCVPKSLRSDGCYVGSLGKLCRWLAACAEEGGVAILPMHAAVGLLSEGDRIVGVKTGAHGIARDGSLRDDAAPAWHIRGRQILLAEGARGYLSEQLIRRFDLRAGRRVPRYALGFKEIWEIDPAQHRSGSVQHTVGWPLRSRANGGGFVYHTDDGRVSVGYFVDLDYRNPWLDPFAEFQTWKTHPRIAALLQRGSRVAFGARVVSKAGIDGLPRLSVPGAMLLGCAAGFLNPARIKGTHAAIKSGMLAAEATFEALQSERGPAAGRASMPADFDARFRASWLHDELAATRQFTARVSRFGPVLGGALSWLEQNALGRALPLADDAKPTDDACLETLAGHSRVAYAKPDRRLVFDRSDSVHLANISHDENQPVHLRLADAAVPIARNLPAFGEPAQRYCPAGVYEIIGSGDDRRLQINPANCLHCKACEIKDPARNISWHPPEGGSGPNYAAM